MRLLYLAFGRDLTAADAGTTHTLSILEALRDLGVEITLAAAAGPEAGSLDGVDFVKSEKGRFSRLTGAGQPETAVAHASERADIIQERAEESGGEGMRLARRYGKPLVLEINTPLSGYPNPLLRKVADWNLRRQARRATAIITQTPIARSIIEEYTRRPVYVVPNGADSDVFKPSAAPHEVPGAGRDRRVVAFAGSLRPWHGVEDLVAAGAQILRRHPEAFFLVIGGGNREEIFEGAMQAALGKGNYYLAGAVRPREVPSWLAAADVLVAPFSPEKDPVRRGQFARYGMWWSPVKIFEYMAMEKPIVAARAGMVPEYTAGAALTFPPGDAGALADSVCRMLEDTELALGLAKAARARLRANYTWRAAGEQTLAVLRETLSGHQKVSVMQ